MDLDVSCSSVVQPMLAQTNTLASSERNRRCIVVWEELSYSSPNILVKFQFGHLQILRFSADVSLYLGHSDCKICRLTVYDCMERY